MTAMISPTPGINSKIESKPNLIPKNSNRLSNRLAKVLAIARCFLVINVPTRGLEPPHLAAYAPQAYVYTNFTTSASC